MKQLCIFFIILTSFLSNAQDDALLKAMTFEMNREFELLKNEDPPAYFMDYTVFESRAFSLSVSDGSITSKNQNTQRNGKANVRVGDYHRDNTHKTEDGYFAYSNYYGGNEYLPLDNNEKGVQFAFWKMTKLAYQNAEKQFENLDFENDTIDVDDYTKAQPVVIIEPDSSFISNIDVEYWEDLALEISKVFTANPDILEASVNVNFNSDRQYYCNTEGSQIVQNKPSAILAMNASIRADDKTPLPLYRTYFAFNPTKLPSKDSLLTDAMKMLGLLIELQSAPIAVPYSGPAILHPRASGVFFHEIFGHRIEGHRLRSDSDGQTFKEKVNEHILPEIFDVELDPTLKEFNGKDLIGHYNYDDEGIKASKVSIVENGILQTFLMSRSPLEDIKESNGHGRAQPGMDPVSRQSNMIVTSSKTESEIEMRKNLIQECVNQGLDYGYYFVDVMGGFTQTSRYQPNAFNITPIIVYKVYVDGRPDELVRGVDLIGTPLAMFAEISSCSDRMETFNGFCGAESGSVPVSATAPGLLVRRIETQKKVKGNDIDLPLLPDPEFN